MRNLSNVLTNEEHSGEDSPVTRAAYALGVAILLFGSVLPHGERWTMGGIALIAFSFLY